jgi:hypothetical protein
MAELASVADTAPLSADPEETMRIRDGAHVQVTDRLPILRPPRAILPRPRIRRGRGLDAIRRHGGSRWRGSH